MRCGFGFLNIVVLKCECVFFVRSIFASLCKRQRRSAALSKNVISQWNGHHFTRFDKQNAKVVDKFHAETLRPNGSRRETNPLPKIKTQKITIKCIDFPSQISIFFVFCVLVFSFHASQSHRRAVYDGMDDISYLFLWMIYVPSILFACNCLRMDSRKGSRHCSS